MKLLLLAIALIAIVSAKPDKDRVMTVPGMGNFSDFEFYSGYLEIPDKQRKLHYVFAESQNDPTNDPLVIWFNGGPGCSSMLGFAQEHGPFVMPDGDTHFYENPNSWNLEANMLYIESPAGVGYSYYWGKDKDTFNDTSSSEDNYAALLQWFAKFPEYKSHDLYISGESYAGIYVPYLAWQIIEHGTQFNLKGIIVGNGVTNYTYDCQPAYVDMGFWHSLYGKTLHDNIIKAGCKFTDDEESEECEKLIKEFYQLVEKVNIYDVYRHCYYGNETDYYGYATLGGEVKKYKKVVTAKEFTPFLFRNKNFGDVDVPCVYKFGPSDFFNRKEVRDSLHIETDQVWELCTDRIDYETDDKASYWIYPILKENGIRILHFSGNADGAVPVEGTRNWIETLNWKKLRPYSPFYIENKQVGGYVENYDGIILASIQGVGHMAAQWSPVATRHAVMNFLKNLPIDNVEEHFVTE
jgi:carboxypeptidase C (cathepsin A)